MQARYWTPEDGGGVASKAQQQTGNPLTTMEIGQVRKEILDRIIWQGFHPVERFPFLKLTEPYIDAATDEILGRSSDITRVELYSHGAEQLSKQRGAPASDERDRMPRWTGSALLFFSIENPAVADALPRTKELLSVFPGNLVTATILTLKGDSHIPAHCGYSPLVLRAHLGLCVPEPEKTVLRVQNETRHWEEKKWIVFDDYLEHEVWHSGTKTRTVLCVDFVKPETGLTPREVAEHFFYEGEGARVDDFVLKQAPLDIWRMLLKEGSAF